MDNEQNQGQPGQNFQPGQPTPAPQPQPLYQPVSGGPENSQRRTIQIVLGGLFAAFLVILLIISITGVSSSLPLQKVEDEQLSFVVSTPEEWDVNISSGDTLSIVTTTPIDRLEGDDTSISISHDTSGSSEEDLKAEVDALVARLNAESFQSAFGVSVRDVQLDEIESDKGPAYRLSYVQTADSTQVEHIVQRYFYLQPDNTLLTARFSYSQEYVEVEGAIEAVLKSYKIVGS